MSAVSIDDVELESADDSPESLVAEREDLDRARIAIRGLSRTERAVLEGHYFEDRQFSECARELGITKWSTSRCHARALRKVRRAVADRKGERGRREDAR